MKMGIFILICFVSAAAYIGFLVGSFSEAAQRRSQEISNHCAHYDTDTGVFTWGPPPVTITMPTVLHEKKGSHL